MGLMTNALAAYAKQMADREWGRLMAAPSGEVMTDAEFAAYVLRVCRLIDTAELDEIGWTTQQNVPDSSARYGWRSAPRTDPPVMFYVNVNDLFFWGTADLEEVTPDNIGELERAYADCQAVADEINRGKQPGQRFYLWRQLAQMLFAARQRQLRPQGCCYPEHREFWPLFDAAGPERELGPGNPCRPGETYS